MTETHKFYHRRCGRILTEFWGQYSCSKHGMVLDGLTSGCPKYLVMYCKCKDAPKEFRGWSFGKALPNEERRKV